MNEKNNKDNQENGGFSFIEIFGGLAIISGAVLFILDAYFESVFDYLFTPIATFIVVFILFTVGYSVMHTLAPQLGKLSKWLRNLCIFLLVIGLALTQFYVLKLIF